MRDERRRWLIGGAAALSAVLLSPVTMMPAAAQKAISAARLRQSLVRGVRSWAIQYRRIDPFEIAASPFDLVVIDIRPDVLYGTEFGFSKADVTLMQRKPDGSRRLVIGYMSTGEAEDYRSYWQSNWTETPAGRPGWIGSENPRWKGNYPVRFWEPAWASILLGSPQSYLDRIVSAGFDGVYLDRTDVYEEFLGERPSSMADMAKLVTAIASHARRLDPKFLVVLQNAEELALRPEVRAVIDVFAKEDLFYGIRHDDRPNTRAEVANALRQIRSIARAGSKILLVEYPLDVAAARDITKKAKAEGFTLLLADRELSKLAPVFPEASSPN